jgi:guanylate kinase
VLSGPSGCGKTTLARQLEARAAPGSLVRSVSVTTRPPRPGEREGIDYSFVNGQRFDQLLAGGALLEHADMFGPRYGTPRAPVVNCLAEGIDVVLVLDAEGRRQLKDRYGGAVVSVFLSPPSLAELERRLRGRCEDNSAIMAGRLAAAPKEREASGDYDHVLVNRDRERTLVKLLEILRAARSSLPARRFA